MSDDICISYHAFKLVLNVSSAHVQLNIVKDIDGSPFERVNEVIEDLKLHNEICW